MMRHATRALVLVLASLTLILARDAPAQQLPPGVKEEVLGEWASTIPGIEKMIMKRFTLAPKAKLENFTPENTDLCVATAGAATVTMGDKKIVRKAGQSWVEDRGVTFPIENTGTVPFVDLFFELVQKK